VLGSPIAHSLSPVLHRAAYGLLGLDWTYDACEVDAAGLPGFLDGLGPEWAGLSLTMPLKAAVLPLLDAVSPAAARVGAVNTVLLADGVRNGDNTDIPGIGAALTEAGVGRVEAAAVLGGGATARSALAALGALAGRVEVAARPAPGRPEALRAALGDGPAILTVGGWPGSPELLTRPVVVDTTPGGITDPLAGDVPEHPGVLLAVAYDPWPTRLAAAWAGRGGRVVSGLDLLVHQAVRQVRLMTGRDDPRLLEVVRAAGRDALAR
jgi:shikimate dehydrogenase